MVEPIGLLTDIVSLQLLYIPSCINELTYWLASWVDIETSLSNSHAYYLINKTTS